MSYGYNAITGKLDRIGNGGTGGGNVVGPGSSVNGNIAIFDSTSGTSIADSGFAPGEFLIKASNLTDVADSQVSFDNVAPTTAKGDLIAFNGTNNVALPVGSNGYMLYANSSTPTGLEWGTPPTGSGDVSGPPSAVNGNFASFSGTSGTVIADSGFSPASFLQVANNLSDLANAATARTNLGLGTMSVVNSPAPSANGGTGFSTYAAGDLIFASAVNTLSKLPVSTDGFVLTLVAGVPAWQAIPAAAVQDVTGTAGRIVVTGTTTKVLNIDPAYIGQSTITTLGTISSGTWQGTTVAPTFGGTGQTTYATGDIIYSSVTNTLSKLPIGSTGQVLTVVGGIPAWQSVAPVAVTDVTGTTGRIVVTGTTIKNVNIDPAYIGQNTITTLGTITTGVWNGSNIPLANGGTSASLTASNGGIFYSTASAGAILAGTAVAGRIILSGASTTPAWSVATFPSAVGATGTILRSDGTNGWLATTATFQNTLVANGILYASATNVQGQITTANNGTLITNAAGVPSILAGPGVTGKILYSQSGAPPQWSTPTYPAIAGTAGQVMMSDGTNFVMNPSPPDFTAVTVDGTTQGMAVGTMYITNNAAGVTYTLPVTAITGQEIRIVGKLGISTINQNANQKIYFGSVSTTTGITGSLTGSNVGCCIQLTCITTGANTEWMVSSSSGNWTYA